MPAKPDTRMWYCFGVDYHRDDPTGRAARGYAYRHVKGPWIHVGDPRNQSRMVIKVQDANDAMMLRLYMPDHSFSGPPDYADGSIDYKTVPASVFRNGAWHDATQEELDEAERQERQEIMDGVDEMDDMAQYLHETRHER